MSAPRHHSPGPIRKAMASLVAASLLVTSQGFFFYEAVAAQFVAPKVAAVAPGSGAAGSAGGVHGIGNVSLINLGLSPKTLAMGSILPSAPSLSLGKGPALVSPAVFVLPEESHSRERREERVSVGLTLRQNGVTERKSVINKESTAPIGKKISRLSKSLGLGRYAGREVAGRLKRLFENSRKREQQVGATSGRFSEFQRTPGLRRSTTEDDGDFGGHDYVRFKELKQILGEGTEADGWITPFVFRNQDQTSGRTARTAGLEGFFYSKVEHERDFASRQSMPQMGDYFKYIDALLAPIAWTGELRRELARIRDIEHLSDGARNVLLNEFLIRTIKKLREEMAEMDRSQWGRSAHTYAILSRAYNRLRPGKNFFDSLDDSEIMRIRDVLEADQIWLLDIFEIGNVRRWGTGGGSPYAIKGYRKIKKSLGGVEAFSRFVERAHRLGVRVRTDFIPNHTALDSELIEEHPDAFIHILPPQHLSDEEIMAGTPREDHEPHSPVFYLIKTQNYPGRIGRETKVLIHHPRTDYGDVMWIDMGQIDFSNHAGRKWIIDQALHLFGDKALDSIRRDMAYYVLNEGYYSRWGHVLRDERDSVSGWAREEMDRLIGDFERRWKSLGGAEILAEMTDAVKQKYPHAVMDDEAYAYFTGLSRIGADGVYGKNTHDEALGQVGLYDALRNLDVPKIRAAMRNNIFRFWQRGGATIINFIGNHDESNPVDAFGRSFRAAAATALMGGPILTYNGFELGTGQRDMLGDLPDSIDKNKAIPFDVPVSINWRNVHEESRDFLLALLETRKANEDLFLKGAGDVLEPVSETPIVAWTASRKLSETGAQKTLLVAANYHWDWAWGHFKLGQPVLADFGAFAPRADRNYILRDRVLHKDQNGGQPLVFERSGRELLENGLFIHLAPGDAHIFEVEEVNPNAPAIGPPEIRNAAREFFSQDGSAAIDEAAQQKAEQETPAAEIVANVDKSSGLWERFTRLRRGNWDDWTELLTNSAILAFLPLQVPQIVKNFGFMAAGTMDQISILPWMGYSTGILGNMLLLSYFVSQKEAGAARVQAVGVLTSAVVVTQIFHAGFMPALAFWIIAPTIAIGLLLNYLNFKGRINGLLWKTWNRLSGLGGLAVLPLVLWATFSSTMSYVPAILTVAAGLMLLTLQGLGKLPKRMGNVWAVLSAWTATALFMFGPIAQLANNINNPANIAGISLLTLLLATAGNMLMLPRAVLTKDRIWFTGSFWAVSVGGWVVMLSMFMAGVLSPAVFFGFSLLLPLFTAFIFRMSMMHHRESLWKSMRFMFRGK